MTDSLYVFVSGIGFALGALAMGLWVMLGIYWWRTRTNSSRIAMVWLSASIVASQSIRLWTQLTHLGDGGFPTEDWIRLGVNLSFAALAYYMFKHQVGAKSQDFKDNFEDES